MTKSLGLFNGYERGERDRFDNRIAFYMAAVGSAVGFGNVWRFPYLCANFGGAAFLIPYTVALFLIGIPVLFLEIGLGQYHQTGDVGVFGSINIRLRGIGVASVVLAYILVIYYTMLISWCWNSFFDSFTENTPWMDEDLDSTKAETYFWNGITGMGSLNEGSILPTRVVLANMGYSLLTWVMIFFSIAFGSKWTGRITYFTMGFPIILLFVFLFRSAGLEGAGDGVAVYIGRESDFSALVDKPSVWTEAVTQIFFSLGVTMGVMTAYGSLVPRTEPALVNTSAIAIANCTFSFLSGFAVFSAIGHLSVLTGVPIQEIKFSSFGLVFGTWPVVLSTLPGGIHWVRLLFLNLILLGIDSAFSIVEGIVTVVHDTSYHKDRPKWMIVLGICVIGFLASLLYATDAGLFFLDTIDYYINFMMLIIGFLETFSAGWIYGRDNQIEKIGATSVYCFMIANFGGATLGSILWFVVKSTWGGFVIYILFYLAFTTAAIMSMKESTNGYYTLFYGNVAELRDELSPVIKWVPNVWCFLIKHFIPQVILILFINGTTAKVTLEDETQVSKFGNYSEYAFAPFQLLGLLCVAVIAILFLVGLIVPDTYKAFAIYENSGKEFLASAEDAAGKVKSEKGAVEKPIEE